MEFKKTSTQKYAIDKIVSSIATNIAMYGSSRSGKSFLIAYIIIVRACKETSDHIVVRNTFNSAKITLFQKTFPDVLRLAFPNLQAKYDLTNHVIIFPNKSTIRVAGLDDQHKLERLLGLEVSTIWFNEANQIPWTAIGKLRTRLAQKNGLKKMSYYDLNPTTKSSPLYQVFEMGVNPVDLESLTPEEKSDYLSIQMNVQGNIENIDKDYIKMLEKLPEKERQRFLLGNYSDESDGQVYYSFDYERHVKETEVKPGTTYIFMDFNVSPMTATIAQLQNGCIVIHDEVWLEVGDTFKMCEALKKKGIKGTVIPDSTGANRKTSGASDFDILRQNGFQIPYVFNPAVSDRVNNVNRLFQENRIIINPRCKKLINDFYKVVWKNNSIDQSGANKMLSHISDGVGYGAWFLLPLGIKNAPITSSKYR